MKSGFRAELPEYITYAYGRGGGTLQLAVVIELSRRLEYEPLCAAGKGLVSSFPILSCRYVPGFWRDRWEPLPEFPIGKVVTVMDASAGLEEKERELMSEFIDYLNGWPLRVVALNHGSGCRLLIIYPHLLGDADAGLSIAWGLGKWLYGEGLPQNLPMHRGAMHLWRALGLGSIPALTMELLREMGRLIYVPMLGKWNAQFTPAAQLSGRMTYRTVTIRGDAYRNFVATCKKHSATINDGLCAVSSLIAARRSSGRYFGTIYTVNLRRFLKAPETIIANFSGVQTLAISRKRHKDLETLIPAVAAITGEHKRRLLGIAFGLLPILTFFWMPAALMHWFARNLFGGMVEKQAERLAGFTNVGSMDEYLEPFGEDATDAWMLGPFQRGFLIPLALASGFRDRLTVAVSAADDLAEPAVLAYAQDWRKILDQFAQK